ncbi:type II toxin-antitoxin system RelE/ParE family toxin [Candidatus Gracilibacteria bacterium]|nr:type II toxin-antitoxin system RelE/ParE family toxin [Candidatus Gracilibacteria bacterium]
MPREDDGASVRSLFFTSEFKRNIRQLARKYRRIKTDIQPILDELGASKVPGDRIPGINEEVYKVRARNSDSQRGKSGGYRMIYEVTAEDSIILLTVYSKTEQDDISPQEIAAIITAYSQEQQEEHQHTGDEQETQAPETSEAEE